LRHSSETNMTFLNKIFKRNAAPVGKNLEPETVEKKNIASLAKIADFTITGIIKAPHLTEKTSNAAAENKYMFVVASGANKVDIRRAIEDRYKVAVEKINVVNTIAKERRRGRITGWKPGFKKAIVTLKEGQKIEL